MAVSRSLTMLSDRESAEDVAQEVLLKLWQARDRLEESTCPGYVSTLSRNLSLNLLRSQKRHPKAQIPAMGDGDDDALDILDFQVSDYSPQSQMEDSENQSIFDKAMQMLPYSWQQVLRMRNIEEMPFDEIAKVMSTTESSVRGLLSKARMQMLQNINKLRQ